MKNKKWIIGLILLLLLKIIIVEVQPLNAKYTMKYDDLLMVDIADNIMQGNWLGEYNEKTLIKGVFTPIFMTILSLLHIPFLMGKEIFYGIACITFILMISKKIKSKKLLYLIYLIILMNPIEYSSSLSRAYRDEIYISLILYLLAFSLGIFFSRKEEIKKQIKYFVGFGISLSATYLCREENIWLLPFIVFMMFSTIIPVVLDKDLKHKVKRLLLYCIPLGILFSFINLVCLINSQYYGVYCLNQYWGTPFKSAYGALTRIVPENEIKRVPVTKETMKKLYENSPKFAILEEFFEGEKGIGWSNCGKEKVGKEITGGYFHWALIDAVALNGYYHDAKIADEYYIGLAEEINELCDQGIIQGRENKRISNTCYFDFKDIINVIKKVPNTIKYQYSFSDVEMKVVNQDYLQISESFKKDKELFEKVTREEIILDKDYYEIGVNKLRIEIIETIKKMYLFLNPYILYISILCFCIFMIYNIKDLKKVYEKLIILISLILIYITRIFIITFTSQMMFKEALNVPYISSIYNIQYLFCIFSIIFLIQQIYHDNKGKIKTFKEKCINLKQKEENKSEKE